MPAVCGHFYFTPYFLYHLYAVIYSIFVVMTKIDYIIVGCGLAGIAFCEQLRKHEKSFIVFDDASQNSSSVAAGLYNPVVLKRFTEAWKGKNLLDTALPMYKNLEQLLQVTLDYKLPVYRKFSSIEEQNEWFTATDKPSLQNCMSTKIIKNSNSKIIAPYGFGEVLNTGRIDTDELIDCYRKYLKNLNLINYETFDYQSININKDSIQYHNLMASNLVFAEGFGVRRNPYFNELPITATKGEIITIKAPDLKLEYILKASVFIIPIGDDTYIVGATYNWSDKTKSITEEAKLELTEKLKTIIACDFEVIDQVAGIRPTVKDRRPLVGSHPLYNNIFVLNGLGTRGVLIAPFIAEQLYNFIEYQEPLDREIDIKRLNSITN